MHRQPRSQPAVPGSPPRPAGLNSERIGRDNLATVLREVHLHGGVSRSELVERTGLYRQTIRSLVGQLEIRGLVTEVAAVSVGRPGRPSFVVQPRTDRIRVVAIDIEVDSIAVGLVGLGGIVVRSERMSRPRAATDPEQTVADVVVLAGQVLDGEDRTVIRGLGVAVTGVVRRSDGVVRLAPNLGWTDVPLAAMLDAALGLGVPIAVGNEADLGGLAEHLRGAAAGAGDVLYVSGEVGIGGGVIVAGRPLVGHGGYAGEIGHVVVNPMGEPCGCGATGCWETEIGEVALLRRAGAGDEPLRDRAVARILGAAADGDPLALDAVREVGRWTGIGIAGFVNIFNPAVVVLGGLHARLYPMIAGVIAAEIECRTIAALRADLVIRPARFGLDAPLIGAAELAFEPVLTDPTAWETG